MKALANTVSVLKFLAGVVFVCAVGIATAWAAGTLTALLLVSPDVTSIRNGSDLAAYPWDLLIAIIVYLGACLMVFHAIILVLFITSGIVSNFTSQQLEYSYLILSILSLFAITDVVSSLAKYRMQPRQESASQSFAMFTQYEKFAITECDKAKTRAPLAGLWIDACNLAEMSNQLVEEPFYVTLGTQFEEALDKLKDKWTPLREKIRQGKLNPSDLTNVNEFSRLVDVDLPIMGDNLKDVLNEKENIKRLGEYTPPPIFAILRYYGYYVLAYALALRLARATAEATGLVKK
jgi:hypothetical protein